MAISTIITSLSRITLNTTGLNAPTKCSNQKNIGWLKVRRKKKARIIHILPTRDLLQIIRHTGSEGMEKYLIQVQTNLCSNPDSTQNSL